MSSRAKYMSYLLITLLGVVFVIQSLATDAYLVQKYEVGYRGHYMVFAFIGLVFLAFSSYAFLIKAENIDF